MSSDRKSICLSKNAQKNLRKSKRSWNRNFRHKSKVDLDVSIPKKQKSWWD